MSNVRWTYPTLAAVICTMLFAAGDTSAAQTSAQTKPAATVRKAPQSPPKVMRVCANPGDWNICSTWKWVNGHYDGWREWGAMATMTVDKFTPESVIINRADTGKAGEGHPGAGFKMVYRGTISSQGDSILDGVTVSPDGTTGAFRAYWGPALQSLPAAKNPANQPHMQQRASAQRQFQTNMQNLAMLGLLLGKGGDARTRVNQFESELQNAKDNCHHDSHNVGNTACDNIPRIEADLRTARGDYDDETQELIDAQKKLSAECKSGNKQSCQTLDQVNHQLENR